MFARRTLVAIGASAALAAIWPSGAFAADEHFPPTPGAPNCHGEVLGFGNSHGHNIAATAKAHGTTVQELQESIRAKCASH